MTNIAIGDNIETSHRAISDLTTENATINNNMVSNHNNHQKSKSDIDSGTISKHAPTSRRSSIEASEYNFSRRTSLYNINNSATASTSENSGSTKNTSRPKSVANPSVTSHGSSLVGYHGRHRNSVLLEELSQFEHEIRNTLPESVEEIDEQDVECEYEEHNIEKASAPSSPGGQSPYKVGRAQFYSCQRRAITPQSPPAQPKIRGELKEGGPQGENRGRRSMSGNTDQVENNNNPQTRKGSLRRGSLNLGVGINGSTIGKWVKSSVFNRSNDEDDKYYLVKSGTLEQLVEQCLLPHRKLDDPFFKDIMIEQYSMFTDKVSFACQLLNSAKRLLASNFRPSAAWRKPNSDLEDTVKENVKVMISKWRDRFGNQFEDSDAVVVLSTLITLSVLINSVHLKKSLELQKRLLVVKVKCFIVDSDVSLVQSESELESTEPSVPQSNGTIGRNQPNGNLKHSILPNKHQLAVPGRTNVGGKMTRGNYEFDTCPKSTGDLYMEYSEEDPRKSQTVADRKKKRPTLPRSLSNSSDRLTRSLPMEATGEIEFFVETRPKFSCPFSPEEVAKQLTFMYSEHVLNMQPFEIVQYAKNRLDSESSLQKIILLNKELEEKIPSTILLNCTQKLHKIAHVIEFWLKVAEELKELRNYECLQIVVHSINSPMYDSSRLPEVWSYIDKMQLSQFERLKETVSIEDNYQILRELQRKEETEEQETQSQPKSKEHRRDSFKNVLVRTLSGKRREKKEYVEKPGFIPCMNVIKKDILGIMSAHKLMDSKDKDIIDFAMHRKIHQQLQQIQLAQRLLKRSLQLQHNKNISEWFNNIIVIDKLERDRTSSYLSKR